MAQHWYNLTGSPQYTIIGANGKARATTLKDARKLSLVPSVTTILQIPAKPAVNAWINDQILEACLSYHPPKSLNGDIAQWKAIILDKAQKVGREAAKKGTIIHDGFEQYFKNGYTKLDYDLIQYLDPVIDYLRAEGFNLTSFEAERSFASKLGFGGKIDLISMEHQVIIDFKTKPDKAFDKKELQYAEHRMQLAAYAKGLDFKTPVCYNIFVSHETPGKFKMIKVDDMELERSWKSFYHLLNYWQITNNYLVQN